MNTLKLNCPHCERRLRELPMLHEATTIHTRTCRHCRARWQVKIAPRRMERLAGWLHFAEFVRLGVC